MIAVLTYRLGAYLAGRLPVSAQDRITEELVRMQYAARVATRRVTVENLGYVMGNSVSSAMLERMCRTVMSNFGRSICHFLRVPHLTPEELSDRVDYNGLDGLVRGVVGRGSGLIFVGPHVGPWEVGGAALRLLGARINTVAWPHGSRRVTRFFTEQRRRVGVISYPVGGSAKAMWRALDNGEALALLIDRAYANRIRPSMMFGRRVMLPTGHAELAVRFGIPIISVVCVFGPGGGYQFDYRGPHYPDGTLSVDEAVCALHDRCRDDLEYFIRRYPEQWFHFTPFGEAAA